MDVKPVIYARKPFNVEAYGPITDSNIDQIAAIVKGSVKSEGDKKFIKVKVHQPKNDRQTKAYLGDWVLLSSQGYKVYTDKAFKASFEPSDAVAV